MHPYVIFYDCLCKAWIKDSIFCSKRGEEFTQFKKKYKDCNKVHKTICVNLKYWEIKYPVS